ncbi:MAG: ABC transporter substrate-binding protein [Candidatus Delongbacteria bacterium]|nr:ABC transporter substrate-binding protein [Candidatus Delongbacteria bacterium]MBN2834082.1 ABC transporter substrate-binding protein [Candidatus Delongbacteria bacterium]
MKISISFLIFAFFLSNLFSEKLSILTIEEAPSSYIEIQNGKKIVKGFVVDFVKEIQKEIGDSTTIEILPEARVFQKAVNEPNIIFFSFSRTPEREDSFYWITPVIRKPWTFYGKKDSGIKINILSDLHKVNCIGVVRGDVREGWLKTNGFSNVEDVTRHEQNLRKLMLDRITLIFYEPQGLAYLCNLLDYSINDIEPVFTPYVSDVYIAISKNGTSQELVDKWKDAANKLKDIGVFRRIAEEWSSYIWNEYKIKCDVSDEVLGF